MAIEFTCQNGHKLRVKESSAGKTGRCPVCNVLVRAPKPPGEKLTEEAILGILGLREPTEGAKPPPGSVPGGVSVDENMLAPKKKSCPQCHREVNLETHICPHCQTYIASVRDF